MKNLKFLSITAFLLTGACATPGGGPFGMVMFDPDQHVSAAEPLFGKADLQCLDDATFLLTLYAPDPVTNRPPACSSIRAAIAAALPHQAGPVLPEKDRYGKVQRNEVVDGLMAASDRKCGRYIAFLQQYDGNVNSTFGIAALSTAALAAIATGGTAQALAAASSIAGGSRNTLNQSHFNNQTIGVLANAFETVRKEQREKIAELQNKSPADYTLMRGVQDVTRYHANCSIVVGLKAAQRAVEEADSPSISSMQKMAEQLEKLNVAMQKAGLRAAPALTVTAPAAGVAPVGVNVETQSGVAEPAP